MVKEKVFVIVEDWRINSGESGVETSVFSSYERAKEYYLQLKENYLIDYEDEDLQVEENICDENTYIELEGYNECNADYFCIKVMDKKIDSYFYDNGNYVNLDNQDIDIDMLEKIYNQYVKISSPSNCDSLINDMQFKKERIMNFVKDIKDEKIIVKIFDNGRDMLEYLFVDGKDEQQIIDGIVGLFNDYGKGIELDKYNVYKINNKYVYILY